MPLYKKRFNTRVNIYGYISFYRHELYIITKSHVNINRMVAIPAVLHVRGACVDHHQVLINKDIHNTADSF